MRHYEIVFLVHPDQADQTQSILDKFSSIVKDSGGQVHRLENIGSKKLSYPIQDQFKASYCLLNVECNNEALKEIKNFFNFNDSIIRELILSTNKAYKEVSALSSQVDQEEEDPFSDSAQHRKNIKSASSSLKAKDGVVQESDKLEKNKEEATATNKEAVKENRTTTEVDNKTSEGDKQSTQQTSEEVDDVDKEKEES